MRKFWIRLLAFSLLVLVLVPVAVQAQATDPLSVYKAYVDASNRGDVEQTLSYFADNATQKTIPAPPTGGTFSGKDQLRAAIKSSTDTHNRLEAVSTLQVVGDKVTGIMRVTSDNFKNIGVDFIDLNFEAIVTNGKITSIIATTTPESLAKLPPQGGNSGGAPSGVPAAGLGGSASKPNSSILAWLVGLLFCGSLVALMGLRLAKRGR